MQISRYENLEIIVGTDETIDDVRALVEKTQDLTLDSIEVLEHIRGFNITVKRSLEAYPDTLK